MIGIPGYYAYPMVPRYHQPFSYTVNIIWEISVLALIINIEYKSPKLSDEKVKIGRNSLLQIAHHSKSWCMLSL